MSVRFIVAAVAGAVAGYVGSGFTSFNPQAGAAAFSLVPAQGGALAPTPQDFKRKRRPRQSKRTRA